MEGTRVGRDLRWGSAVVVALIVSTSGAAAQSGVSRDSARSLAGRWDATVVVDGVTIPCRFEIEEDRGGVRGSFFNGEEKITSTAGTLEHGVLTLTFAQYGSRLTATVGTDQAAGQLTGQYDRRVMGLYPFHAERHSPPVAAANAPSIAGSWKVVVNGKSEAAWTFIVRQNGADVSGAIQRVDGDTGMLEGRYRDGTFVMSHFSGARPILLVVTPKADGSLQLVQDQTRTFVAVRENSPGAADAGSPADPFHYTRMKNPDEPFRFRFPDLEGRMVSDQDSRFRGKVVIATITGSWCANCHDEAPFLASLYRKYRGKGLEIVALAFEEAEQLANPTRPRAFIKHFGIDYPFLLAGEPEELAVKIPQAENLNSFPTMFMMGRDGRVRSVHAGYSSVATGALYTATTREITAQVERLLKESVKVSE